MPSVLTVVAILLLVAFLNGCAFFSDGATIDYSRMFAEIQ